MERNKTIDALRLIFSFMIIGIHAQIFQTINFDLYNLTVRGLFRIAVPFFFVVSGYFYCERVMLQKPLKPYFMKLLKYFMIFEGIELLLYTIPSMYLVKELGIIGYLWRALVTGLGGAYWYIFSTIVTLLILTPFLKKDYVVIFLVIGLILNLLSLSIDSYSFLFENSSLSQTMAIQTYLFRWPQAGLNMSLLYISLGALLYKKDIKVNNLGIQVVIGFVLLIIESMICQRSGAIDGNSYFSLYYLAPTIFLWALSHPDHPFYKPYFAKLSLLIYMIHPIALNVSFVVVGFLGSEARFIFASILSYLLGRFIIKKQEQKGIE